jgi:hypothetical protein
MPTFSRVLYLAIPQVDPLGYYPFMLLKGFDTGLLLMMDALFLTFSVIGLSSITNSNYLYMQEQWDVNSALLALIGCSIYLGWLFYVVQ